MLPVLFKFGPVTIYSLGFFLVVAYLAAAFIFWKEGKRQGYSEEKILDLSLVSLIGAFVVGRLFFVLLNFELFRQNLISTLFIWEGGFSFYGALVGVAIFGYLAIRKWRWPYLQVADFGSLGVIAAYFFVKIGSFLSGVDYGIKTSLSWAVEFPNVVGARHPTQLYEAAVALIAFIFLKRAYEENIRSANFRSGKILFYSVAAIAFSRFLVGFWRVDTVLIGSVKADQFVSILVAMVAFLALYYLRLREFRADFYNILKFSLSINNRVLRRLRLK